MPSDCILFLSNAEYGALNPMLAVCHEVMRLQPSTAIHFAAFESAAATVKKGFQFTLQCSPGALSPSFHTLPGLSCTEALLADDPDLWFFMGKPVTLSTMRSCHRRLTSFSMPWEAPAFLDIYKAIEGLVKSLSPSLIVVDLMLSPGLSLCKTLGVQYVVVSPNTLKDLTSMFQPRAQGLWRYPAPGCAYSFPIPWYHVPWNVLFMLALVFASIFDGRRSRIVRGLRSCATHIQILTMSDLVYQRPPGLKVLVGSRAESDLPLEKVSDDLIPCGPIVRAVPRLAEVDKELAAWLANGPTVFVNLGSLAKYSEDEAVELAMSLRILLEQNAGDRLRGRLRVLWKLKQEGNYITGKGSRIYDILEPASILATGDVICIVHHGGANSYNESLVNGVPQIILPVWADTYDFANRVEWLGIGRWGSQTAAPRCDARELGPILVDVVLGPRAGDIRDSAQKLAQICNTDGGGAAFAANEILKSLS